MEKIEAENLLHRAFSVFLFNSKFELLLQVFAYHHTDVDMAFDLLAPCSFFSLFLTAKVKNKGYFPTCVDKHLLQPSSFP